MSKGYVSLQNDDVELDDDDERDENPNWEAEARTPPISPRPASDDVVVNAIKSAKALMPRKWEVPSATDAMMAACGIGAMVTTVFGKLIGTQLRIKEMVPMSKTRWAKFVGGSFASAYASAIPAVGQVVSPLGTAIASRAEGKGKANVAKDTGMALAGSAIDGAASIASLGGYTAYTEVMAGIGTSLAIFLKAKYYADTWRESKNLIEERLQVLSSVRPEGASWGVTRAWKKEVAFLKRQVQKCGDRGEGFNEIADKYDKEIKERIEKLKNLFRNEKDRALNQPLLAGGERSDDNL